MTLLEVFSKIEEALLLVCHYLKSQMKANDYLHARSFHSCSIHGPSVLSFSVIWAQRL